MSSSEGPVCLFCNNSVEESTEGCRINLEADWTEASGTYWCHGSCLQMATHPEIPLYLLSLRRDSAVYGTKGTQFTEDDQPADRTLSEREAFRAAKYFIEQFNEREKSDAMYLLTAWMREGIWSDPRETADPAQWYDWVESVNRVIAERDHEDAPPHGQ